MGNEAQFASEARLLAAALRTLPDDVKDDLRREGQDILQPLVSRITRNLSAVVQGDHIRVTKTTRRRQPAVVLTDDTGGGLIFGTEFGSNGRRQRTYMTRRGGTAYEVTRHTTRQFPSPHTGRQGRYFYPAVRAEYDTIVGRWGDAVLKRLMEV